MPWRKGIKKTSGVSMEMSEGQLMNWLGVYCEVMEGVQRGMYSAPVSWCEGGLSKQENLSGGP